MSAARRAPTRGRRGGWWLVAIAAVACRSAPRGTTAGTIAVPTRAATAGDALLAIVPAGADLLIEVDLARLRANPVVGPVATAWLAPGGDGPRQIPQLPGLAIGAPRAPLAGARALVIAAYDVGRGAPAAVTLIVGDDPIADATPIARTAAAGPAIQALGPPELVARVQASAVGAAPAIAGDRAFLALRARAMPAAAASATLRVTARFDLDARVALTGALGADLAPAALSLWADVVDDVALVAVLDGHDAEAGGGRRLAAALGRARIALAGSAALLRVGLAPTIRAARVVVRGDAVDVIATIGPRRLAEVASRLAAAAAVAAPAPDAYSPRP